MNAECFHTGGKRIVMLLGENRRRHEHHRLAAGYDAFENRPHSHFCFAESYVAAEEHIHRLWFFHGPLHRLCCFQLVRRFHIREGIFKFPLLRTVFVKGYARRNFPFGVYRKQPFSQFLNGLFGLAPDLVPGSTAHFGKHRRLPFRSDIFFESADLLHRKVELVPAGVLDRHIIPAGPIKLHRAHADVPSDAVNLLHHVISLGKFRKSADFLSLSGGFETAPDLGMPQNIPCCIEYGLHLGNLKAFTENPFCKRDRSRPGLFRERNPPFPEDRSDSFLF